MTSDTDKNISVEQYLNFLAISMNKLANLKTFDADKYKEFTELMEKELSKESRLDIDAILNRAYRKGYITSEGYQRYGEKYIGCPCGQCKICDTPIC